MYTIYLDGHANCFASSLEKAVEKGRVLKSRGVVVIEAPTGNITEIAELEQFLEKEALFLANW